MPQMAAPAVHVIIETIKQQLRVTEAALSLHCGETKYVTETRLSFC